MKKNNTENKALFWADQLANEIITRKKYRYINKKIPKMNEYVVKTSASLSGVLHIGRLSDTIRGETVFRALEDAGVKAKLIWVAEDMDPLRKIPKSVPKSYSEYLGMPVTDIPDPDGCHNSYAEHHKEAYLKVIGEFVSSPMRKFSMREEYRKGSFRPYIKNIIENADKVIEIQNKYRSEPVSSWSPWMPICKNCGKIITPRIQKFEDGKIYYKCQDYKFASTTAKGCGYEGISNPLKDPGKLVWKSEWASQWAHWKVASEGAGKEYQVPMSAWWVNAEIVEKILDFPMPVPIFYEHLMIDGKKMSASIGNVVYPEDWLEVAEPEILKFFYNKKIMKTRSFSFKNIPRIYDDYDRHAKLFYGTQKLENKKESEHMKRLYSLSYVDKIKKPCPITFDFAVMLSQVAGREPLENILERVGYSKGKLDKEELQYIKKRVQLAKRWVEKYSPESSIKILSAVPDTVKKSLTPKEKQALKDLAEILIKKVTEKRLYNSFWNISNKNNMKPAEFFKTVYKVLTGKEFGPKLAPFILSVGKEKVLKLLKEIK